MSFFQVDDALALNSKAQGLARRAMTGDVEGVAALGLWTLAGSVVQAKGTDGCVELGDLVSLVLSVEVAQRLAGELVAAGLWHGPGHDCHRCPPVEAGRWYFHDWAMMRYERGADAREKRAKTAERNSKRLQDQVWARDRIAEPGPSESERALCAYCLTEVVREDRRSDRRPEVDHVEPRANGLGNLVIACRECNRRKGNRRPAEAGMTLHVTERHRGDLAAFGYRFELVTGHAAPMWAVLAASDKSDGSGADVAPVSPAAAPTAHVRVAPVVNGSDAPVASCEPNHGDRPAVNGSDAPVASCEPNRAVGVEPCDPSDPDAGEVPVYEVDLEETQSPHGFSGDQPDPGGPELSRACAPARAGARGRRQGRAGQGKEGRGAGTAGPPPPPPPSTRKRRRGRRRRKKR